MSARRSVKREEQQEIKPMNYIISLKSSDDLRTYLEEHPSLNLSIMSDKTGATLLHFAAFKNDLVKMKIYILHFEAYIKENHGKSQKSINFQNQLKAWINVISNQGLSAIHFAGLHGNIQMIEFLQRLGANLSAVSSENENLLFMCVQNNHLKTVIQLIECERSNKFKFNLSEQNIFGDTILHKAVKCGYLYLTLYLLTQEDIDPNSTSSDGSTALHYAVQGKHREIIKKMLLKGINRNVKNHQNKTPFELAKDDNNQDLMKILDEEFTACEKLKIICNLKIVYREEKPSYTYPIVFLTLFHLLLLPTNLATEITCFGQDLKIIPRIIQVVLYLLVIAFYAALVSKQEKKERKELLSLEFPICAECKNSSRSTDFHCYICSKCIYRYDHHCPWINNCVGAKNIGKFTTYLILLVVSCLEVTFLNVCLYFNLLDDYIKLTDIIPLKEMDLAVKIVNIATSVLSLVFAVLIMILLVEQLKNLFTNTTSYERLRNKSGKKKEELMGSYNDINSSTILNDSMIHQEEEDEECCRWVSNCVGMLRSKGEAG